MQRIHSEKLGKSVSKDGKKVKMLSNTLMIKCESSVRVIGWGIVGDWAWWLGGL